MARRIKIVSICFFCVILFVPMLVYKQPILRSRTLRGIEQTNKTFAFNWDNLVNGSWQRQFERKASRASALFPYLIKSDNQLNLLLFRQLSSNYDASVVLGNNSCLVEKAYIREANKLGRIHIPKFIRLANDIAELQRELQERGIGFLLLISPSKVALYRECLAPEWRVAGIERRKSKYEVMIPLLQQREVSMLDAHRFFASQKHTVPFRFFPDSGTHWGHYAACLIAREIQQYLANSMLRDLPVLHCDPPIWPAKPTGSEIDIAKLTNLWSVRQFLTPVPAPRARVEASHLSYRPNILFVGSSFMWNVLHFFDAHRLYRIRDFWYYFKTEHSWPRSRKTSLDPSSLDWSKKLLQRDVVIIEINEAHIDNAGFGFIRAALISLTRTPKQP